MPDLWWSIARLVYNCRMGPRLFAPALTADSTTLALPPDEADHLVRVLRITPGAAVRVFDGRGLERHARVRHVGRHDVQVDITGPATPAEEGRLRVTLAQALLKGDKIDGVIRDAVMMGVAAVQPLLTARTDVPPSAVARGGRLDRWRRISIASAKQCGRAVVPDVLAPVRLEACLEHDRSDLRLFLREPAAGDAEPVSRLACGEGVISALVLVGPEGGWSADECAHAEAAGCRPLRLGRRTLRADAAALIALGVLQHLWGDL
jgi:16S rRNA (uracil1498-N3)-methyltransferase